MSLRERGLLNRGSSKGCVRVDEWVWVCSLTISYRCAVCTSSSYGDIPIVPSSFLHCLLPFSHPNPACSVLDKLKAHSTRGNVDSG